MSRIKGLSKTIILLKGYLDQMEPLIITAAITGGKYVSKAEIPYVPCSVDEIVEEALRCVEAGLTGIRGFNIDGG